MILRFSEPAIQSLISIRDYIAKDSPASAARVAAVIVEAALRLKQFPQSGRLGRLEDTRELVVPGLPYILPYRVVDDTILILSALHTSRKWPGKL
jgi:addiction module RelE/StbE family toxin